MLGNASKSNGWGSEVADTELDCFFPRCWINTSYFNLTCNPYFFPFCSLLWHWPGKIMPPSCVSQATVNGKKCAFQIVGSATKNLSVNSASLVEMVYTLTEFILSCECLDGWCITKQSSWVFNCALNCYISLFDSPGFISSSWKGTTGSIHDSGFALAGPHYYV